MNFDNLNLHPKILKALADNGYSQPTEIQLKAIPEILEGFDLRASAQTGTGKTAAFLLPALNLLSEPASKKGRGPRVLILAPTRELAMQIGAQSEKYSKHLSRVRTVCVGGGVPIHMQIRQLQRPYEILIATPGRLLDLMERGKMDFSRLEMLVLDEADRMLDMGFMEPVTDIVNATPSTRQTLLFSATLQGSVVKLSERFLNDPKEVVVHSEHSKHENITQSLYYVDDLYHKNRLLDHILEEEDIGDVIIFTSTKRHADQLVDELREKGQPAAALHGDMNQGQRTRTIKRLRLGKIKILVATDVAARGIDVQSITHVINFDLPRNIEDYVHRIGRTGRAGAQGVALSFAAGRDAFLVKKIEGYTGQKIDVVEIEGLEPRKQVRPSRGPRGQGAGRGQGHGRRSGGGYGAGRGQGYGRKSSGGYGAGRREGSGSRSGGGYGSGRGEGSGSRSGGGYGSGRGEGSGSRSGGGYGSGRGEGSGSRSGSGYGSGRREGSASRSGGGYGSGRGEGFGRKSANARSDGGSRGGPKGRFGAAGGKESQRRPRRSRPANV